MSKSLAFLCITCEFKGTDFIVALKEMGHDVYVLTSSIQKDKPWPREQIKEMFFMDESDGRKWDMNAVIAGTSYLFQNQWIDKIIALDDYDVWKAALLREEFRSPGMGQTTARHFSDKLAMRMVAKDAGLLIPPFTNLFNNGVVHHFLEENEGPWLIKPRMDAGAVGIEKMHEAQDIWSWLEKNEEVRANYLLECFKPGAVYHVDSLVQDFKQVFCRSSRYLDTPFEVAHGGGVFQSQTLPHNHEEQKELKKLNAKVLKAFGLRFGASHAEFIKNHETGEFYFLETSARVGGAHLAEMVEAASGVNLWREWAKLECAELLGQAYKVPQEEKNNAGIVLTLSKFEHPDYSAFREPVPVWTLQKDHHIGMIVKDKSADEVASALQRYARIIGEKYSTRLPANT